jgi:hypothetical protein
MNYDLYVVLGDVATAADIHCNTVCCSLSL